jgi:ABC-type transport system involved in multi-copper enzyme maturation permease subunit
VIDMPSPPGDFKQVLIVAKFEGGFESWKSVLGNILILAVASAVIMTLLVFAPVRPDTPETFAASFLFPVFFLVPLAAAIFGAGSVTSEFETKTAHLTFSNPVKRTVLAAGKFLASLFYVCCAILIFYLGCSVATYYVFGSVPAGLAVSIVPSILYGCAVLALVFLFGFIFRNGVVAGALMFAVIFLCMPLLQLFLSDMGHAPWYLLTYAAGAINAFGGPSMPKPVTIFGGSQGAPDLAISTAVLAVYFAAVFVLSLFVLRRRDIA